MSSMVLTELRRFGPDGCERLSPSGSLAYVRAFTRQNRENFHVVSRLVPSRLRDDFAAVYAFCRWADDLADEAAGRAQSTALLRWWERELRDCFEGQARHPVFVSLHETVRRHDLPIDPFLDLLDAFRQDQHVVRYDTWPELLDYCRRSANPVGRLVLMLCGVRDERRFEIADKTCTGLQLVNFWQDVRRDVLERDRVYVPREVAAGHGLDVDDVARAIRRGGGLPPEARAAFRSVLRDLVGRTQAMLDDGRALLPLIDQDVRPAIRLFSSGGDAVLRRIRRTDYDTWAARPRVGPVAKAWLLSRAWLAAKGVTP